MPEAIVSEPFALGGDGITWVYSGRTGALIHRLPGEAQDAQGSAIANAGDTTGDGIDDIISGASGSTLAAPGRAHLYDGATGERLHTFSGKRTGDQLGWAVSSAGDADRDGRADVLIGAPFDDGGGRDSGRAYIFSGRTYELLRKLDVGRAGDQFGTATDWTPDVDGDGRVDYVVGAQAAGNGGAAYVISGRNGRVLSTLPASPGATNFGNFFVAGIGDVNRDGTPDVYGADYAATDGGPGAGYAAVFSGRDGSLLHSWFGAAGDGLGPGREAGDHDRDGVGDIAVGSYTYGPTGAGRIQIFSGATGDPIRTITSTTAGENLGFDALGIGDVNGDGKADLLGSAASGDNVYMIAGS